MSDETSTSRRTAIKMGLAALAGLGVSALAPAQAFAGTDGDVVLSAINTAASTTTIQSAVAGAVLSAKSTNTALGTALFVGQMGGGSSYAAEFYHNGSGQTIETTNVGTGTAFEAKVTNSNSGASVARVTTVGKGTVLAAQNYNSANPNPVIVAQTNGMGSCFYAEGSGEGSTGLYAQATGNDSYAIHATITNPSGFDPTILATHSGVGYPIQAEGGKAQLYLKPAATAGPPTTNSHQLGELYVDSAGKLYSCTAAGTPGTWTSLIPAPAEPANKVPALFTGSNTGYVVRAEQTGAGYAFETQGAKALKVDGAVSFSRSGRSKVAKGKKSVTVTVPGGVGTAANVICTMQGSGGTIRYAKRYSATKIKIQLTKAATSTCYVAWMVLG